MPAPLCTPNCEALIMLQPSLLGFLIPCLRNEGKTESIGQWMLDTHLRYWHLRVARLAGLHMTLSIAQLLTTRIAPSTPPLAHYVHDVTP